MNLSDYQNAALVTAQPRAFSLEYLIPMIVGEIGELFGQKAKAHWHGWDADKLQAELISEFGDVAWGTAILLHTGGISTAESYTLSDTADGWQKLLSRAHDMHLFYSRPLYQPKRMEWVLQEASYLWSALEANCEAVTGVTFDVVLQANLAKLAGRVQRGTLVGSGDHR